MQSPLTFFCFLDTLRPYNYNARKNEIMPRTRKPNGNGKLQPSEDFPLLDYPPWQTLKPRHRQFVFLYWLKPIKRWNNAKIIRMAYDEPNMGQTHAYENARKLLRNPQVTACVRRMDQIRLDRMHLSVDRIVEEESCIAFSDVGMLFDEDGYTALSPAELPPEIRRAVSGVEIKEIPVRTNRGRKTVMRRHYRYQLWNKGESLKRLSQIKGLYSPTRHTHEVSGPGGSPIPVAHAAVDLTRLDREDLIQLIQIAERVEEAETV